MRIQPIRIQTNVIREIPPPALRSTPPPVVSQLEVPVVDVPNPIIDYPTIDVPTQQRFEQDFAPPQQQQVVDEAQETRDLPPPAPAAPPVPTGPVVSVGGVNVTLPPIDTVATTGATAVVATTASLTAALLVKKATDAITEIIKKKKFKVKVKKVKPVLHFVKTESGTIDIFEYSKKGTRIVGSTEKIETYLRDQINDNAYYEVTNKIIVDDNLRDEFTNEGKTRFKSLFVPAAKVAKKLSAKFSV